MGVCWRASDKYECVGTLAIEELHVSIATIQAETFDAGFICWYMSGSLLHECGHDDIFAVHRHVLVPWDVTAQKDSYREATVELQPKMKAVIVLVL